MLCLVLPIFIVSCKLIFINGASFYEGDECTSEFDGKRGTCTSIYQCSWALSQIRKGEKVHTCSFTGKVPVICCPSGEMKDKLETSSERIIPKGTSSFGELSRQSCKKYYPPPITKHLLVVAAVGGEVALSEEFPHMAILGYGTEANKEWKCGGSLISERHILTAAHCLYSRDLGEVKYVRLGDLDIASDTDISEPQDYYVKRAIPHPDFNTATLKHDIAILELNDKVRITSFVKPACLSVDDHLDETTEITAAGWGITEFAGQSSSKLIKVQLKIVTNENCRQQYAKSGVRADIDNVNYICAGSADVNKIMDTCQGDSGGPLQKTDFTNRKHYTIIGVTSFGKACGIVNSAGVYTRVSAHIPWIESILYDGE